MKKRDKIIAAFLASMGIFSAAQAVQYVNTLDGKVKDEMFSVAKASDASVFLCTTSTFPQDLETKPKPRA